MLKIPSRREAGIALALFIPLLLLHLWNLMRIPPPFLDEVWYVSRAWGYVQTGQVFGDLDRGIFDYYEGYWTLLPWLPIFLKSLLLRFSPVPDLFAVRLMTLFFGFVLLFCLYLIARQLGGHRLAVSAVLLTATSSAFVRSSHIARTDIEAAAFGYLALALYFLNRSSRAGPAFLSGFCIVLAYECHPHGVILVVPIVALYFLHQRWAMFRSRAFWSFVGGGLTGIFLFVLFHILPYPDSYFQMMRVNFAQTHTPPLLTMNPTLMGQAFIHMAGSLLEAYPTLTLLVLSALGIALALIRRSDTDKTLLVLATSLWLAHILLIRNKISYYTILSSPLLDLMAAYFLVALSYQSGRSRLKLYLGGVVGVLVAVHVVGMVSALTLNFYPSYQRAQQGVNEAIEPGDTIMGPQPYWLELYTHPYYPWEALVYYRRYSPGSSMEDALARFQPDIFIIDLYMREFIVDSAADSPYGGHIYLARPELEALLAQRGELISEFDNGIYGPIQIYRLRWDETE